MPKIQINTMADLSEIVHYDIPDIPLYIQKGLLSSYPGKRAVCHWHDDIELILITLGEMNYYINGHSITLHEGEALLVNSQQMHYGYSNEQKECEFICILFHPSLLSSCTALYTQSVEPFLKYKSLPYMLFNEKKHCEILDLINQIWDIKSFYCNQTNSSFDKSKRVSASSYAFDVIGTLYSLWASINHYFECSFPTEIDSLSSDVSALRKMVSFIHNHYKEAITLNDIADSANICRSKCSSVFTTQINQSPFDFLNSYRLQLSADMLTSTSLPITDIAFACGFNHSSYYSKLFYRQYGCTPRDYRRLHRL